MTEISQRNSLFHRRLRWLVALAVVAAVGGYLLFPGGDRELGSSNLDLVLAQLEENVVKDPQDPVARLAVAIGYLERGLSQRAAEQFEQVLVLSPDNQTALIGLGQARLVLGEFDAAAEPLLRVAELNEDNERRYTIDQLNGVYYDLGRILVHQGDLEQALGWLIEALLVNSTDADSLLLLGTVHEDLGDLEAADAAFRDVVRLVPDYTEAYEAMGQLYERTDQPARQRYADGMIQLINGRIEEAVTGLEAAIELAPDMAEAHEGLGMAYESAERPDEALAAYERALELNPSMFLSDLAVQRLGDG